MLHRPRLCSLCVSINAAGHFKFVPVFPGCHTIAGVTAAGVGFVGLALMMRNSPAYRPVNRRGTYQLERIPLLTGAIVENLLR
jgi:3-hydroxymyristoyl/3-hydroxydecanoyl-(acyl carrier protein) dehydratase